MTAARRALAELLEAAGWRTGTDIEDRAAWALHRFGWQARDVHQQHPVGRYRLDFAWPDLRLGLEIDGWHHRSPAGAAKDATRDSRLRSLGWLIVRVDDQQGEQNMLDQLAAVSRLAWLLKDDRGWPLPVPPTTDTPD